MRSRIFLPDESETFPTNHKWRTVGYTKLRCSRFNTQE
jgi:hypothetical protein